MAPSWAARLSRWSSWHLQAQQRAKAPWERQAGGHPRQDLRGLKGQGGKRAYRSPSHPQPWLAAPDSPGGPVSHPRPRSSGPGCEGEHRRHLLGAEAERQKPEAWGLRRQCQGLEAGGGGQSLGQLVLQTGPSSSHGEGASLDRRGEMADPGTPPSMQGPLNQQVSPGNR